MSLRNLTIGTGAVLLAAAGCGVAALPPTPSEIQFASQKWPGTTVDDLEQGRSMFEARCSLCHALPFPDKKTPDQWVDTVRGDMGSRARLSMQDRDLVARYLGSKTKLRPAGG